MPSHSLKGVLNILINYFCNSKNPMSCDQILLKVLEPCNLNKCAQL